VSAPNALRTDTGPARVLIFFLGSWVNHADAHAHAHTEANAPDNKTSDDGIASQKHGWRRQTKEGQQDEGRASQKTAQERAVLELLRARLSALEACLIT
jgi:hypothetical protein